MDIIANFTWQNFDDLKFVRPEYLSTDDATIENYNHFYLVLVQLK